jgi:8-oxo-dGTP diphosphatase
MHVLEFRGEPRPNDGQELRWVSPDEARTLPFLPADIAVVRDIRPPLPSTLETP